MSMHRMYREKIIFYWRYGLIIAMALIALNTIPPILNGIAEGNEWALRENISEAQGGRYVLKGYTNGDYTRSVLGNDDIYLIDSILKAEFPDSYEGYIPVLKGQVRISMNPEYQYSAWVEASRIIESNDKVYLSSSFHPEEDEGMARYRVNENMGFKKDLFFERTTFEIPESDNPMLSLRNGLFAYMSDIRASFPAAQNMLGYPAESISSLILIFNGSPSFAELETILSSSFTVWTHDGDAGFSTGVFRTSEYTVDTVISFENLDDDLIDVTMNLIDNGQATSLIREIEKGMARSLRLSRFFTVALSVIIFMTMLMELESRRKEMELTVNLGGTYTKVVYMVVVEKLLLTLYSIVISWAIILVVALIYELIPISDPIEALFTRNSIRVFSFNFTLSLKLFLISLAITGIASVVSASISWRSR